MKKYGAIAAAVIGLLGLARLLVGPDRPPVVHIDPPRRVQAPSPSHAPPPESPDATDWSQVEHRPAPPHPQSISDTEGWIRWTEGIFQVCGVQPLEPGVLRALLRRVSEPQEQCLLTAMRAHRERSTEEDQDAGLYLWCWLEAYHLRYGPKARWLAIWEERPKDWESPPLQRSIYLVYRTKVVNWLPSGYRRSSLDWLNIHYQGLNPEQRAQRVLLHTAISGLGGAGCQPSPHANGEYWCHD